MLSLPSGSVLPRPGVCGVERGALALNQPNRHSPQVVVGSLTIAGRRPGTPPFLKPPPRPSIRVKGVCSWGNYSSFPVTGAVHAPKGTCQWLGRPLQEKVTGEAILQSPYVPRLSPSLPPSGPQGRKGRNGAGETQDHQKAPSPYREQGFVNLFGNQ